MQTKRKENKKKINSDKTGAIKNPRQNTGGPMRQDLSVYQEYFS